MIDHLKAGKSIAQAKGKWTSTDGDEYHGKTINTLIREWAVHEEDGFLELMPERGSSNDETCRWCEAPIDPKTDQCVKGCNRSDNDPPPPEQERGKPSETVSSPSGCAPSTPATTSFGGKRNDKGRFDRCADHPGNSRFDCDECCAKIDAKVKEARAKKKAEATARTISDVETVQREDTPFAVAQHSAKAGEWVEVDTNPVNVAAAVAKNNPANAPTSPQAAPPQQPPTICDAAEPAPKPGSKTVAWPGVGIVDDMPENDYHAINALSSSALRGGLLTSIADYLYYLDNPPDLKTPMAIGSLTHYGFLEGGDIDALGLPIFAGKEKTRNNKAFRAAIEADPRTHLQSEFDAAKGAIGSLKSNANIVHILKGARIELSVFWVEKVGDVEIRCKARLDSYLTMKAIGDLKVTGRGTGVQGWFHMRRDQLLHFQLAFYRRGAITLGLEVNECLNILAPNCEPFGPSEVHPMPWRDIERADHIIETVALPRLASHIQNPDGWKGVSQTPSGNPAPIYHNALPDWAFEDYR